MTFEEFLVGKIIYTSYTNGFNNITWEITQLRGRTFLVNVTDGKGVIAENNPKSALQLIQTLDRFKEINENLYNVIDELYPEVLI